MKKFTSLFFLFFFPSLALFGWGNKGHKLITSFALKLLPIELKIDDNIRSAIIKHSVDPDTRKKNDPSEAPKHFIDIDYYKEFLDGRMITSKDSLSKIYGENVVTEMGILPWATEISYSNLVNAFKKNDKEKLILFMSDLAHYVGDGFQPQHTTINYNGQLTSQKGIHFRYEIEMIDNNLTDIEKHYEKHSPVYFKDINEYIFDYITESNSYIDLILSADKFSSSGTDGKFDSNYYRLLWFRTKYFTINQFNSAAFGLASLIYSAWVDAGKPVPEY